MLWKRIYRKTKIKKLRAKIRTIKRRNLRHLHLLSTTQKKTNRVKTVARAKASILKRKPPKTWKKIWAKRMPWWGTHKTATTKSIYWRTEKTHWKENRRSNMKKMWIKAIKEDIREQFNRWWSLKLGLRWLMKIKTSNKYRRKLIKRWSKSQRNRRKSRSK